MTSKKETDFEEMVRKTGSFINKEFLKDVLCTTLKEGKIKVVHCSFRSAVKPGNNYMSVLYKTTVKYTINDPKNVVTRQLMVKGPPPNEVFLALAKVMGAFEKEIKMYTIVMPAMHKLLQKHFPKGVVHIGAESYRCNRENTIVMEDLQAIGYVVKSRRDQLDFDHTVATLQTLARFHALSIKIHEQNPSLLKDVSKESVFMEASKPNFSTFLDPYIKAICEDAEAWGLTLYAQDIRKIANFFWEKLEALVLPSRYFNVLGHGDLWTNNIMFRYHDNGEIESCRLIDLQLTRFSSPVLDVFTTLCSSVQPKVVINHMFELLGIYHKALISDAETLGVHINYPIERLHQDMRERAAFGFFMIAMYLRNGLSASGGIDTSDRNERGEVNWPKNKYYNDVCRKLLQYMGSLGYFEDARVYTLHVEDAATNAKQVEHTSRKKSTNDSVNAEQESSKFWFNFDELLKQ